MTANHMPLLTELANLLATIIYKHDTPTEFHKKLAWSTSRLTFGEPRNLLWLGAFLLV
jgi:hypothetical protein